MTSDQIWEDVKANHAKLSGCSRHDFEVVPRVHPVTGSKMPNDYRCKYCGGVIDAIKHVWWARGVRDAGDAANPGAASKEGT